MPQENELIAYAMDFASYLISKVKGINKIILHGSIARGDFDENSDVDLFIDSSLEEKKILSVLEGYYKTKKFKEWQLKGIKNEFSIIVGKVDGKEWRDLRRAIINTGIILYGKYKSDVEKINNYVLFSFENIKPDKKRVAIFRKIFGFTIGKKRYSGLAEKINAVKIGKGALLVKVEHVNEVKKYFQSKNVSPKLYDLWSDVSYS